MLSYEGEGMLLYGGEEMLSGGGGWEDAEQIPLVVSGLVTAQSTPVAQSHTALPANISRVNDMLQERIRRFHVDF